MEGGGVVPEGSQWAVPVAPEEPELPPPDVPLEDKEEAVPDDAAALPDVPVLVPELTPDEEPAREDPRLDVAEEVTDALPLEPAVEAPVLIALAETAEVDRALPELPVVPPAPAPVAVPPVDVEAELAVRDALAAEAVAERAEPPEALACDAEERVPAPGPFAHATNPSEHPTKMTHLRIGEILWSQRPHLPDSGGVSGLAVAAPRDV